MSCACTCTPKINIPLSHAAQEMWPQKEPDLKTTLIFSPQLARCSPQGFDDGRNFFIDCRFFLKNHETLPNQKLSNHIQRDLVKVKL